MIVDLVVVALAVVFVIGGYQQGFIASIASFVGFLGGAVIGLQLASPVAKAVTDSSVGRVVVAVVVVLGSALLVQLSLVWAAHKLRGKVTWEPAQVVDRVLGALVSGIAALLVAWMVATPLATSRLPELARAVRDSQVVGAVDAALPTPVRALYDSLRDLVGQQGLPDVLDPLTPTIVTEVDPPNSELANSPAVAQDRDAIVKIVGQAPSCSREVDGSGFVFAEGRVMTNAHVLAGVESVDVETTIGDFEATPVYVDEQTDVAVLDVPGLPIAPLQFAGEEATSGADAIVAGFPHGGPFTVNPARVREIGEVRGPDFRDQTTVIREVYTLRGIVQPGNSGGPLLATDGTVLGVIFASSVDDPDVGYALTADQVANAASAGIGALDEVGTGACS